MLTLKNGREILSNCKSKDEVKEMFMNQFGTSKAIRLIKKEYNVTKTDDGRTTRDDKNHFLCDNCQTSFSLYASEQKGDIVCPHCGFKVTLHCRWSKDLSYVEQVYHDYSDVVSKDGEIISPSIVLYEETLYNGFKYRVMRRFNLIVEYGEIKHLQMYRCIIVGTSKIRGGILIYENPNGKYSTSNTSYPTDWFKYEKYNVVPRMQSLILPVTKRKGYVCACITAVMMNPYITIHILQMKRMIRMKNEDLECLAEELGLEIKGDTVFGFFKPITVDEFWLIVSEHLSECVQKGMFENVAFECMLQNKCELAELCSKIEKHIKERNVHMKVDLECMMNSCNVSFNSIALTLGLEIVDDKVYPGKPVSLDNFKKAIGEYVAEEIESGNNSALIFESLAVNDDDRDCLKEMIFDAPCEVDSDD